MQQHTSLVTFPNGNPAADKPVHVYEERDSHIHAAIYADSAGLVPLDNPVQTDGSGVVSFYVAGGDYWLYFHGIYTLITVPEDPPISMPDEIMETAVKLVTDTTTGTSLVDDSELFVAVAANSTYLFESTLFMYAEPLTDLKIVFEGPADATVTWSPFSLDPAAVDPVGMISTDKRSSVSDIMSETRFGTTGGVTSASPSGIVTTTATAGVLKLKWAQWNSGAEDSEMQSGSWLRLTKVA